MKLTIDRKTWLRGKGADASALLKSDGQMCCLGFYAKACGLTELQIMDKPAPASVGMVNKPEWDLLFRGDQYHHETNTIDLMLVNDRIVSTDSNYALNELDRESSIIDLFAKYGVEVEFVG